MIIRCVVLLVSICCVLGTSIVRAQGAPATAAAFHRQWLAGLERQYPNLIYNPSFEVPSYLQPARVAEFWQDRPTTARDTETAHSGTTSLRLQPGTGYTFQTPMPIALIPGTAYTFSLWARTGAMTGKGVAIAYTQVKPAPRQLAITPWSGATTEWKQYQITFTTPADHVTGMIYLHFDLKEGDAAWVDDVCLQPTDGKVPSTPLPTITPNGGPSDGPATITLSTDLPGATIRYTTDGSDPTMHSWAYTRPLGLRYRATLKARVFHAGHREGPVATATFDVRPRTTGGVPFYPADWSQDVEAWWSRHIYNAKSPQPFTGPITSPTPRINVADVRDKHPNSTTGGIEEALAMLPVEGGTLWFPKDRGPYLISKPMEKLLTYGEGSASIIIKGRSNLHFLSDGAVISGTQINMFLFTSTEYAETKTQEQPITNFYFQNLVFDGGEQAENALYFKHSAQVLFDGCTFRNFVKKPKLSIHPAVLVAHTMTDNFWVRNCRFEGGFWHVYWDGVHEGGILNSYFGPNASQGGFLVMTNNDMAPLSPVQRTGQYIVVEGNTFDRCGRVAVCLSNSNTLVRNNTCTGTSNFIELYGRGRSSTYRGIVYNIYGNKVLDNTLTDVGTLALVMWNCVPPEGKMGTLIRGNTATNMHTILRIDPTHPDAEIHGVAVEGNTLSGKSLPQIRIRPDKLDRLQNIRVIGNTLRGTAQELVVELKGNTPVACEAVLVKDNAIEPAPAP